MHENSEFSHSQSIGDLHQLMERGRRLHDRAVFEALLLLKEKGRLLCKKSFLASMMGESGRGPAR